MICGKLGRPRTLCRRESLQRLPAVHPPCQRRHDQRTAYARQRVRIAPALPVSRRECPGCRQRVRVSDTCAGRARAAGGEGRRGRAYPGIGEVGQDEYREECWGRELLGSGRVAYVVADGRKGWTGRGGEDGFDAIHVGAAAAGFHQELVDQLKSPGR